MGNKARAIVLNVGGGSDGKDLPRERDKVFVARDPVRLWQLVDEVMADQCWRAIPAKQANREQLRLVRQRITSTTIVPQSGNCRQRRGGRRQTSRRRETRIG